MENNKEKETLLPGAPTQSAAELYKKGFWATIPNKKQFVGGIVIYLIGLALALICSSTQMLAKDATATVTNVTLSSGGENIYVIEYSFDTEAGKTYTRSQNYWTITPEKDLAKPGDTFAVKYMPFLPSTDGTETAYPILMFVGILLFFGGWTMTKGRAPIVQTRKRDKQAEERRSRYFYAPDETDAGSDGSKDDTPKDN